MASELHVCSVHLARPGAPGHLTSLAVQLLLLPHPSPASLRVGKVVASPRAGRARSFCQTQPSLTSGLRAWLFQAGHRQAPTA